MRSLMTGLGLAAAVVLSPEAHAKTMLLLLIHKLAVLASNAAKQTIEGLHRV